MDFPVETKRQKCTIGFMIETHKPENIRIIVIDPLKPNTVYANGSIVVTGKDYFYVRIPISPDKALVRIINDKNGNIKNDSTFRYQYKLMPLKTNLNAFNYHNPQILSFINFISEFANNAGILSAGNVSIFLSNDAEFRIHFVDEIKDENGNVFNTPARISKINNRIEFNRAQIANYTVPAIVAIGLHEFGHGYLNREKSNEIEADYNALRIYLGLGFSRKEAFRIFCKVFAGSPSRLNELRLQKIENFIMRFEKEPSINYQYYYVGENGEKAA